MTSVLPLFSKPAADVQASPQMRPYLVTITIGRAALELHVLAFKSCDAICLAIDLHFDGEYEMPESMSIQALPANVLRAA